MMAAVPRPLSRRDVLRLGVGVTLGGVALRAAPAAFAAPTYVDGSFVSAARGGVTTNPPAGGFSPGGHDAAFWSSQLPAEIAWLAPLLAA